MKRRHTLRSVFSLLCCLAMILAWLPALPAVAADSDKVLLEEGFEQYSANAAFVPGSAYKTSNISAGGAVESTVVREGTGNYLRMSARNSGLADKSVARNRFYTVDKYSDSYTVEYDFCRQSDNGGHFDVYLRWGGYLRVRATATGAVQIYVHGNAAVSGVMEDTTIPGVTLQKDVWYSFKAQVSDTAVTVSVYERDTNKLLGQHTMAQSTATDPKFLDPAEIWFDLSGRPTKTDTEQVVIGLDNIAISSGSDGPAAGAVVPQAPAVSQDGNYGDREWVIFSEDYESYGVGTDTFYGANEDNYTFYSSYHGTPSAAADASYSTYGIAQNGGSKVLDLTAYNTTRNYFLVKTDVGGAYTVQTDFRLKDPGEGATSSATLLINPFQGYSFGTGTIMVYIDGLSGGRITDETGGKAVHHFLTSSDGSRFKTAYDNWYTAKITCKPGSIALKIWARGGQEPDDSAAVVVNNPAITQAVSGGNAVRIQNLNRSQPGCGYGVMLDNFKVAKPFEDIRVQGAAFGVPGSELALAPSYTGQDLSAQRPIPQYSWTVADTNMGTVNKDGKLVLGPKEGQTRLTMELLDLRGNGTGITCTTDLIVGTSNGVTANVDQLKVGEDAIGSTRKVSITFSNEVTAKYPSPTIAWSSSNPAVAKVDASGLITLVGFGAASITAMVKDNGLDTMYYVTIPVQVGEIPLRVLSIGNSYGRDSLYYLSDLAALYGLRVEACYLEKGSGTLRQHARNVAQNRAEYSYWKSNPMTGEMSWQGTVTIGHAMQDGSWDVILLQQGPEEAGIPTTFNTDLEFMLDYVEDAQPDAKIYWNMTWAYQQNISGSRTTNFKNYFNGSQAIMYNAIVDCMDKFIVGSGSKFGARFDGWLPVGAAVQNLRATALGDNITRDGFHMSLQAGRLTAAMTVLKTLYPEADLAKITPDAVKSFLVTDKKDINEVVASDPDYSNSASNMALIRQSVEAACKDLSRAPAKISAPAQPRIEDATKQGDITVDRVDAPLKLHFPDVTVLRDGTVFVSAYEHIFHVPNETLGEYFGREGSGRLVIWKSTDNGRTYEEVLSVDEPLLEQWGLVTTSNRYERWKNGETDYTFIGDARDPNFGLVYFDINGDGREEEVLLYTFDLVDYHENRRGHTLAMTWSIDGGKTWAKPQEINGKTSSTVIKRGDIASFSDGQIMVPTYLSNKIYLLLMDWSPSQQQWVLTHETIMPDFAPEETGTDEFNEMSLIAPDPDGDVIFGYIRANGTVVKSYDRGRTWELIGNEPGLIHQPGFAYIDENRMFVTWARVQSPRTVYGKVFYYNGDWTDTATRTIYASPVTSSHDMADPSCKLMANGEIITVSYDVAYRSIVATFDDPNSSEFALLEMNQQASQAVLYENKNPGSSVSVSEPLPASYTAQANVTFTEGGKLTIKLADGKTVTFAQGQDGIRAGSTYNVAVLTNGSSVYTQVWADAGQETTRWQSVKPAAGTDNGKVEYTGSGVTINSVKVTTRVAIDIPAEIYGIAGGPDQELAALVQPKQKSMVWSTSDPSVATVKDGVVSFVGHGKATITLNAGGAIATCTVWVDPIPAEISGAGETKVLFQDDFEQYIQGTNAFWNAHESKGYKSNGSDPNENRSYNILAQNGNKVLQLTSKNGKATWHKVNIPIVGNYTVQYDFLFTGARIGFDSGAPGHYLYMNLWQDSGIHGFAVLCPEGIRVEYIPEGSTAVHYDPEKFGVSPIYEVNKWHTIKVVRVNGGIYAKVWQRGTPEPEQWDMLSLHKEFDSTASSFFRMQYYAGGTDQQRTMSIDNLTITQQQGKGADYMLDVSSGAWYYQAVDYAIKNGIMSGYNAVTFGPDDTLSRAMVVQVLYNKEGQPALNGAKHNFPDVPATQWFNNAVTWGSQKGVVSGFGDGKFRPDDAVTLEQVAVILHNYSGKPASSVTPTGVGKYDDWAKQALGWAVEKGILEGVPLQNATDNASRAQTAQMLMNFINKVANG